jgi:aspartate/methionine/tyrosine aminotransferase
MLLSLWAHSLKKEIALQYPSETKKLIFAGVGKPTYPISAHTIASYLSYWQNKDYLAKKWHSNPEESDEGAAIDYGDPRGDDEPVALMAKIMSAWYESEIKPEHVLFTVGGIGALHIIFETLNSLYADTPGYRTITPFPHYSAYSNNPLHRLHPIDVMNESGYKVTARALEASIKDAYTLAKTDKGLPKAVLLCNPSNPLGNIIDKAELIKIADVLRHYPDLHIIIDEAYAEMSFIEMPSFLKIAPDLKDRMILLRSATKAFSAAGERMAVLFVFNQILMNEMLNKNIESFIHAPRSAQLAYAETMAHFDASEQRNLIMFYKRKVDYVIERLHTMGAAMPDPNYQVEATFYALCDLSDLFGLELPIDAQRALQKTGKIRTGEELTYYLLFKDAIMITPLSYFGLSNDCGFMRITCSANEQELQELMDRLEKRLFEARVNKKAILLERVTNKLLELKKVDHHLYAITSKEIALLINDNDNCLNLKMKSKALNRIYSTITDSLLRNEFQNIEVV